MAKGTANSMIVKNAVLCISSSPQAKRVSSKIREFLLFLRISAHNQFHVTKRTFSMYSSAFELSGRGMEDISDWIRQNRVEVHKKNRFLGEDGER